MREEDEVTPSQVGAAGWEDGGGGGWWRCVCVILYLISRYMPEGPRQRPPKAVAPLFFRPFSNAHPGRPALPVIVAHKYQQ